MPSNRWKLKCQTSFKQESSNFYKWGRVQKYYDTKLWGTGWSLGTIGEISDNLGNTYFSGSGTGGGGIISKCRRTVNNFSQEADRLIINYDYYNRKYRVEIPLQVGGKNE